MFVMYIDSNLKPLNFSSHFFITFLKKNVFETEVKLWVMNVMRHLKFQEIIKLLSIDQ